jgi:hypothetical protein
MRATTRVAAALALGAGLLGLVAGPAYANSPAQHAVEDVTGDQIVCASTTYTITSGSIKLTIHEGESASGNTNFTGTITPQNVVAVDPAGNVYSLRGAFWFGGTVNVQQGSGQFTDTAKLQIVAQGGGTVDSVNVTFHINFVGDEMTNIQAFDVGSCEEPADE